MIHLYEMFRKGKFKKKEISDCIGWAEWRLTVNGYEDSHWDANVLKLIYGNSCTGKFTKTKNKKILNGTLEMGKLYYIQNMPQ